MQKQIFSLWNFIAAFGPFPAALKKACGLKTQPRLSPFLKHIPWRKWTATCRANRIILPTPSCSCDVLDYHGSALFFSLKERENHQLFANHSIIYLSHTNHRSKASPYQTAEVPETPRSRCLAVHFLLDTHMQACALSAICGRRENIPLKYPQVHIWDIQNHSVTRTCL